MDVILSNLSIHLPPAGRLLFTIPELHLKSGSRALIQGPSGRGKTTLLHLMAGLMLPSAGQIRLGQTDFRNLKEAERSQFRRDHVGIIFQKLNLIPHLTTLENVLLGLHPKDADPQKALEALDLVHLSGFARAFANDLSLGEQQRVAVARILVAKPTLILADEPTSSLDDDNSKAVIDSLLNVPSNTTVITVSHDHRLRDRFETIIDFEKLVQQ